MQLISVHTLIQLSDAVCGRYPPMMMIAVFSHQYQGYHIPRACVTDGNTNSATALRGSYGCAAIHEVSDYYDSSPFVSRPSTADQSPRTLADVTSRTNNSQPSDAAAAAAQKGFYTVCFISKRFLYSALCQYCGC